MTGLLMEHLRSDGKPLTLAQYRHYGGYEGLRKALDMNPKDVAGLVRDAKLTGRGGAGFPAGRKWSFVDVTDEWAQFRFLVANADEMEPGAFKDRVIMEGNPHALLEGIAIASYAIGAEVAYLFLRAEYGGSRSVLQTALAEMQAAKLMGPRVMGKGFSVDIRLHVSAGRYICGEASAMLNAIEGERPVPRHKPPHQTSSGLWSKPTVVNNVETLAYVPAVLRNGADWFAKLGRDGEGGMKIYTVSGRVKNPGAWELPMGVTIRELLEDYAGGMREGLHVRAVLPGGSSTPFVLEKDFDTPMDELSLKQAGSRLGTGTLIVLDQETCPVAMLRNLEEFYAQESCGWCTPCWQGLDWVKQLLGKIEAGRGTRDDLALLVQHTKLIKGEHTFCDLATGAMEPLRSGLQYFEEDFLRHIDGKSCPWKSTARRWSREG